MKIFKFWKPETGVIGGLIMSAALLVGCCFLLPPFLSLFLWWASIWLLNF